MLILMLNAILRSCNITKVTVLYRIHPRVQVNKEKTRRKKRERDRSAPNVAVGSSRGRNTHVEKLAYIRSRRRMLGQDVLPVVVKPPRRDENAAAASSFLFIPSSPPLLRPS